MSLQEDFLTVSQAAEAIGCTPGRVRQMLRGGALTGEKMSEWLWMIPKKAVERIAKNPAKTGRPRTKPVRK